MKPQKTGENLVAAYLMLNLWQQFGSDLDGDLIHDCMGAPEEAGEWLEDLGLVRDIGHHFQITSAGRILMDAPDYRSITLEVQAAVCEACE